MAVKALQNIPVHEDRIEAMRDLDLRGRDRVAALTQHVVMSTVLPVGKDLEQGEVQVRIKKWIVSDPMQRAKEPVRHFAERRLDREPNTNARAITSHGLCCAGWSAVIVRQRSRDARCLGSSWFSTAETTKVTSRLSGEAHKIEERKE
jgi:hypothetical protein